MSIVENSLYVGLENDASEIQKIKQDLTALRQEIEISEQDDGTANSLDINSGGMSVYS